jgi:hypothetical protein
MEDILASIRRILNEDEPGAAPGPGVSAPVAEAPLALTEEMLVSDSTVAVPPPPPAPPPAPPVIAAPVVPPPAPVAAPPPVQVAPPPAPIPDGLLAPATAAAATASVGQLLRAVAQERGAGILRSAGPTIEDVVREELRPLLKEWLDTHLPPLVERLVRAEIARVVGGQH